MLLLLFWFFVVVVVVVDVLFVFGEGGEGVVVAVLVFCCCCFLDGQDCSVAVLCFIRVPRKLEGIHNDDTHMNTHMATFKNQTTKNDRKRHK